MANTTKKQSKGTYKATKPDQFKEWFSESTEG